MKSSIVLAVLLATVALAIIFSYCSSVLSSVREKVARDVSFHRFLRESKLSGQHASDDHTPTRDDMFANAIDWNSNDTKAIHAVCHQRYARRGFLPVTQQRQPPMLFTFPGSGNTWTRLLIEFATGVYTGSLYDDPSLRDVLPGEFSCSHRVSAVKVHPHIIHWANLHSGRFDTIRNKCKSGNVTHFDRALIVLRDPFDSIWSEYQRQKSHSHIKGLRKELFNETNWRSTSMILARAYEQMWTVEYAGLEHDLSTSDYVYLKYEDLKAKSRRVEALRRMLQFLRLGDLENIERLQCAFALAENEQAHRSVDENVVMSKSDAYVPELVCKMWALFGGHAGKHGYSVWNNTLCS